jgi:hypothetical protein
LQIRKLEKKKCCVSSKKTRKEPLKIRELEKENVELLHRKLEKSSCAMYIRELEKEKCCVSSVKSSKLGNFRRRMVVILHKEKKTRNSCKLGI